MPNSSRFRLCLLLSLAALINCSPAQEPEKTPANYPKIEKISESVMKIGDVTLNKDARTITFSGSINMDHGEMEYLLVQEGGKTHESLLVTKAQPFHIHVAMLLLGVKIPPQAAASPPPDAIDAHYLKTAPKPKGDDVLIFVRWHQDGKIVAVHAEDLLQDDAVKKPMSRGPWVYNGSMLKDGVFLAKEDRSIAALVIDPSALINNERPDSDNDQVWSILTDKTPKAGTEVEITIQLGSGDADIKAEPPPK